MVGWSRLALLARVARLHSRPQPLLHITTSSCKAPDEQYDIECSVYAREKENEEEERGRDAEGVSSKRSRVLSILSP